MKLMAIGRRDTALIRSLLRPKGIPFLPPGKAFSVGLKGYCDGITFAELASRPMIPLRFHAEALHFNENNPRVDWWR